MGFNAGGHRSARAVPSALASHAGELPRWIDWLSSAVLVVIAVASVAELEPRHLVPAGLTVALAVAPWLVGLTRRFPSRPRVHALVTLTALAVLNIAGPQWGWIGNGGFDQVSLFIGVWLVGQTAALGTTRESVATLVAMAAIVAAREQVDETFLHAGFVWCAGFTVGYIAGLLMRLLGSALIELRDAQAQLADEAVAGERQRIAREVHDVVAHSLSVTMLHVTAARLAMIRDDRHAAIEALEEAERAGRSSLGDVRRTVGLLRGPGGSAPASDAVAEALPSAADLDELVSSCRTAGMDVELAVTGDLAGVGATVGLALYRIAQEALSNAARHLPGARTTVTVDVDDRRARLRVESVALVGAAVAAPQAGGMGLRGMRERAAALGGTIEAGPTARGWSVTAALPLADDVGERA